MNPKTFHPTAHVLIRIAERGLSLQTLKDVVRYADRKQKQYAGEHGGGVFRFSKTTGGTKITVVAEVKGRECWLITAFYG